MSDELADIAERLKAVPDPVGLLGSLFAYAPVGFQIWSASGQSLLVNPAFRKLFGSEPPPEYNVLKDELAEAQGMLVQLRRAFAGETVHVGPLWYDPRELRQVDVREGRRVAIECTWFPLLDAEGTVRYVATAFKDVTAEMQLRASEENLAITLRSIGDGVIATDVDGRVVRMNPVAEALTGVALEQARGRRVDEVFRLVEEHTRRPLPTPVARVLGDGESTALGNQTFLLGKDGAEYFIADSGAPIRDAQGRMHGAVLVFRDQTLRVRAERALRQSEELLRQALVAGRLVAFELYLDGNRITYSPNATELFGCAPEELSSFERALQLIHPEDRTSAREPLAHAITEGRPIQDMQYRIIRPDNGAVVWFERRVTLIHDELGNVAGMRGLVIDVSERKRAEEIRARSLELELQNRRIQEANRLKSEFLANMSHELRTPLNAIIGFAELLYDGHVEPASSRHHEFLGDILAGGRHLLQLINDVLDLAKVEAGKQGFRPERVQLEKLVEEVCAILRTVAAQKRIRVETELDPALHDIVIDPARFKQVLFNYLSNALKFTGEGGRVVVRTLAEDDESFRLEVEDDGIGIAPADIGRLFVEFQQLDAGATKRHQGTGLGLVLTRRLVEAQGGSVGVESRPGVGSVFRAILPRRTDTLEQPPRKLVSSPPPGALVVLVVEDELHDQEVLTQTLEEAGYAVELATTGAEALALCNLRRYHAVTLDLLLPDMSGLDLLSGIRAAGKNRDVPVVVVTIVPSRSAVAGFAVQDVLHKPLEPRRLLDALSRAGVHPAQAGTILVVDDDVRSLRLMEATLGELGYCSTCCSSGAEGLEAAKALAPRLIVTDLIMPGMDGFELLDQLRQLPQHKHTPVIVWTVKALTPEEQAKLRESALGVITKTAALGTALVDQLRMWLPDAKS